MLTLDSKGIEYANLYQDIKTLLMPKNWIINGQFDVWQRGTSFTAIASSAFSSDRYVYNSITSTVNVTRETFAVGQTDVPNNPTYYVRNSVTSGSVSGSRATMTQKIEDVTKLSSKTISISFWAKADANKNMSIEFVQDFGTGGSTIVLSLGVQKFALTTSWQRFTKTLVLPSVNGKTIGSGSSVHTIFWFESGSSYTTRNDNLGNQSGTFDIANVSLVEGSVAIECQNQPYSDVLRECYRYFFPIAPLGSSAYFKVGTGFALDTSNCVIIYYLPVPMRVLPTVTWGDATKFWVSDGASNLTLTSLAYENPSTTIIKFNATKTTSLVQFRPYLFERAGNTDGYIYANAEL